MAPTVEYMVIHPEKIRLLDILSLLFLRRSLTSYKFVESSTSAAHELEGVLDQSWIAPFTAIIIKLLQLISGPMKWIGLTIEYVLNLFAANDGVLIFISRLITGNVVKPERGDAKFLSFIGQIDDRTDLTKSKSLINYFPITGPPTGLGLIDRFEISVMASKLAYENRAYIRNVVNSKWKMHFVEFYDCWNEFLEDNTTQAFIFSDKSENAELIVLAFRGTEPFNAQDCITDVDLSWLSMGKLGRIHMGFLKALGLPKDYKDLDGFPKNYESSSGKPLAYYTLREELNTMLKRHKTAKIIVTGHSLGGALAIIFPSLLAMHEQNDILSSIEGVMTYGQPRVGNDEFVSYMEMLNLEYSRMVYRYDIVPRIPFDQPPISLYKHFGVCIFFDGWYDRQMLDEAPDPNYFDPRFLIQKYMGAWNDFFNAFLLGKTKGKAFEESYVSLLYRATGLIFPGVAFHSLRDYVNSIRLTKMVEKVMV